MGNKNRGQNPSTNTIMRLVAASGGRCQFEGCNCNLFRDELTWLEFNKSNVAHIVGASPNGPRGTEASHNTSNKLENLMLLCMTHHKEIDDFPEKFTVEILTEMKRLQEQRVQELLDGMNYPHSEIVVLESPIKGKHDAHVDNKQIVEALSSRQKNPASIYPVLLRINGHGSYSSSTYWQILSDNLKMEVEGKLKSVFQYNPEMMLAVFPIAPIPLIAKLGELLGDKREIDIFQKTREPDTWCWQKEVSTNTFVTDQIQNDKGESDKIAIILSLTAKVSIDRVLSVFNAGKIYHIYAENNCVDCIASLEDLRLFWQEYQSVCNQITNTDHCESAAVFPAVPVAAAFEIGRRHMSGVHPDLHIYDDDKGFFEALIIGG